MGTLSPVDLEHVLDGSDYGAWTERLAREISVRGGQPDFVYRGVQVRRGAAVREVGDHLLLLGHELAIVSVKARDISMIGKDTELRARAWLDKNIAKAAAQIAGTRRTLWSQPSLHLVSDRGITVPWDASRVSSVYGVVVVNYSVPTGYVATTAGGNVVLAIEDWMRINEALGAGGIFNYLRWRTTRTRPLALLLEKELLAEQLIQDAKGQPALDPNLNPRESAWRELETGYPSELRTSNPNYRWARVVDAVIAAGHDTDPQFGVMESPYDYLEIAELLERLHPETKIELGQRILEKCRLAYEGDRRRYFAMDDGDDNTIVFISDPAPRDERRDFLKFFTLAMHTVMQERGAGPESRTVGVATEPYPSAGRSHDLMIIRADIRLDDQTRKMRDELLRDLISAPRSLDRTVLDRLNEPKATAV